MADPHPPEKDTPPRKPAVYTVPPHQSFVAAVARGVLERLGDDPLKLADLTILVPDRDTGFLLRQAFLQELGGRPGLMPHIDAPGDINDGHLSLKLSANPVLSAALMDIPPPVARIDRQLILAGEIMKISGMASSLQKAIHLGGELGRFIDEMQENNVEIADINKLVPEAFKAQWARTAEFLDIITGTWPKKLQELGKIDPAAHKNALMQIQAAHWRDTPPQNPIIAVGFTDTNPATVEVLKAVAEMPNGIIVLPGVDLALDDESWRATTPVHPQFGFRKMLESMGIDRADVRELGAGVSVSAHARANDPAATSKSREKLLREAMRPAGTAEGWSHIQQAPKAARGKKKTAVNDNAGGTVIDPQALNGIDLVTCGTPQEEASVIALKFRETLEAEGRTAMLVTADRSLARRVSARLRYWKIDVPDSAGTDLANTPAGIYLQATAQMAADEWAPIALLEALKHPLAAAGLPRDAFREKTAVLEDLALHGPRPDAGAEGLRGALAAAFNRRARKDGKDAAPDAAQQADMAAFIDRIEQAGKPFFDKMAAAAKLPFTQYLDAHIRFAEALAADDTRTGADRLWRGDDGVQAARFLSQLRDAAQYLPPVTGAEYADVLKGLMRDVKIRRTGAPHPMLKIVTPEQAQLTKADVVIMGGLNDESWPRRAAENPWLSPDMIRDLGLRAPEESIGKSALQFVQAASNPNVLLSRSVRSGNAPAVSSPFLTRLMMVLKGAGLEDRIDNRDQLRDIHIAIHTPSSVTPVEPPAPKPPVSARPKQLPVTAVEALMRDPYSVYAKYVLKLRPREPLDASPNVSEKGIFTHAALEEFINRYPDKLPEDAYQQLLDIGAETFRSRMDNPSVQSFWWPRFERIARWFVGFEAERREMSRTLGTEVQGRLEIDIGNGEVFTLTAIADRIDRDGDDKLSIIDYKTGSVPMQKAVSLGFSPQLTLEALIAFTGGFDGIDAHDVGRLQYWKLSGGRPAADVTEVKGEIEQLVADAREGIENLMKAFNDADTPYLNNPRPEWAPRYQNYAHLSRAAEWSTVGKVTAPKKQTKKTAARRAPKTGKGGPQA